MGFSCSYNVPTSPMDPVAFYSAVVGFQKAR